MDLLQIIFMGIVQGLSEFLPISSSAHLVFTSNFYKVFNNMPIHQQSNLEVFVDIMLHLGTLIAVLIYFRKEVLEILSALIDGIKQRDYSSYNCKLALYIIFGTVITVLIAFPLNEVAENLVYSPVIVGLLLILTGIMLFASERYSNFLTDKKFEIDFKTSVYMAIAQGLAALPGFSRSGWTIASGLFRGADRVTAARYSFLLSIPIILGASMVYPFIKIDMHELVSYNWTDIIIGTVVSGVVGYLCIKYFLKFVGKYSLKVFAYYCLIAGGLTSVFFYLYK